MLYFGIPKHGLLPVRLWFILHMCIYQKGIGSSDIPTKDKITFNSGMSMHPAKSKRPHRVSNHKFSVRKGTSSIQTCTMTKANNVWEDFSDIRSSEKMFLRLSTPVLNPTVWFRLMNLTYDKTLLSKTVRYFPDLVLIGFLECLSACVVHGESTTHFLNYELTEKVSSDIQSVTENISTNLGAHSSLLKRHG